jgi:Holliday junction resolvase RusA-like endonuclease
MLLVSSERESWQFTVPGKPITQGSMSVFNGRVVHQKSKELTAWRNAVHAACAAVMDRPLTGAVQVEATFTLDKPKATRRTMPYVRPDIDKLARAILDGLTGIAFADDGQVTRLVCEKQYGIPGAHIRVSAIGVPPLFPDHGR